MRRTVNPFWAIVISVMMLIGVTGHSVHASQTVTLVGKYDSRDLALIKSVDTVSKTISFRNHETGRDYTLGYDNTSMIYSQYGRALSAALLQRGSIADITFLSGSKHLNSLDLSGEAFNIERSYGFDFQLGNETARIGNTYYRIPATALILIDGRPGRLADVLPNDSVRITGIGTEIYCVEVTKGHGYVSLSSCQIGDEDISGAYLSVGDRNVSKVTDNMMMSVPEGTYDIHLTGNGVDYETQITVDRDQHTVVDTSQIEVVYEKGRVTFIISPDTATVKIDGVITDLTWPVELTYGTHRIQVEAEGYLPVDEYLHVGSSSAEVEITMVVDKDAAKDEDKSTTASSASENKTSAGSDAATSKQTKDNTADASKSSSHKSSSSKSVKSASSASTGTADGTRIDGYLVNVAIENGEQEGVELYNIDNEYDKDKDNDGEKNNVYLGTLPCSFTKVTGEHVIELRKKGYVSKRYRITVTSEKKDQTYKFKPLVKDASAASASTGESVIVNGTVVEGYNVYIDNPMGADVHISYYLNGQEQETLKDATVPCHFPKVTGTYIVILSKEGYKSKSYAITIDGAKTDKVFSFPDLEKDEAQEEDDPADEPNPDDEKKQDEDGDPDDDNNPNENNNPDEGQNTDETDPDNNTDNGGDPEDNNPGGGNNQEGNNPDDGNTRNEDIDQEGDSGKGNAEEQSQSEEKQDRNVYIYAKGGSEIFIDSKSVGTVSEGVPVLVDVSEGTHDIRIVLEGYEDFTYTITVPSAETYDVYHFEDDQRKDKSADSTNGDD